MKPLFLEAAGEAVAGFHHAARGDVTGVGVVFVPALGWDDQCTYRPRRFWAEALADAGHASLRLDLPGTGDSQGGPLDPDRVGAWTAAIVAGALWLREDGCTRVVTIGLGVGGLLALSAVAEGDAIDDAVLWGTPARGRSSVRELKAFERFETESRGDQQEVVADGGIMSGGHRFSAETVASLSALDASVLLARRAPGRALVLGRDAGEPDPKLVAALGGAGVQVNAAPGTGWSDMHAEPQAARPPRKVMDQASRWLAAASPAAAAAGAASASASASLSAAVRETRLLLDADDGHMFGVLSEPIDAPVRGTAVLLNIGAIRHIGPGRMWAETGRRWAALGIATLRVDLHGLGDADGGANPYLYTRDLYGPFLGRQTQRVLDQLAARGLPERFLLSGACSGGYWAFQTALRDPRVETVVTLNQGALFFDHAAESQEDLKRLGRVLTPSGVRDLLRGERRLQRLWRLVTGLLRGRRGAPRDRLAEALGQLQAAGQGFELAFSANEPARDELERLGSARLGDLGVRIHELPNASHLLRPLATQQAANAVLDEVARRFADGQAHA